MYACKIIINLNQGVNAQLNLVLNNILLGHSLSLPLVHSLWKTGSKLSIKHTGAHLYERGGQVFSVGSVCIWVCQAKMFCGISIHNYMKSYDLIKTKPRDGGKNWAQTNKVIWKHDRRIWKWKWYAWSSESVWQRNHFFPTSIMCGICGHSSSLKHTHTHKHLEQHKHLTVGNDGVLCEKGNDTNSKMKSIERKSPPSQRTKPRPRDRQSERTERSNQMVIFRFVRKDKEDASLWNCHSKMK